MSNLQKKMADNVKINVSPDDMEKISVPLMDTDSSSEKPFVIKSDKKESKSPLFENDDEMIWSIFKLLMDNHSSPLVRHQVDSFNEFLTIYFPKIIQQYNPILIYHNYNEEMNKYETEVRIYFSRMTYNKPIIHENNGSTKAMYPANARLRNLTYNSNIYIDMVINISTFHGEKLQNIEKQERKIANINIGKIPIMLMSKLCFLKERSHVPLSERGECQFEQGGYFIINGSEKVIISQERQAENKIYCFKSIKTTKYSHVVEIKSSSTTKMLPAKTFNVKITSKDGLMGKLIYVNCNHFRQDIPLFVLFRALGIESDRDIVERIVYDVDDKINQPLLQLIQASLEECSTIMTQHRALEYLSKYVHILGHPKEIKLDNDKRISYVKEALENDLLPHLGTNLTKKIYFIGYMVRKLLFFFLGYINEDDRDSYSKKRIDQPGVLMANLVRQYVTKLIKDIRNSLMKEMNHWTSKNIEDLINQTNIYKIVKSTTIDSGTKYSLATGNWGMKNMTTKVGVAQVLNRLSYLGSLSHLRRVNTPIDKTSKLIQPRKLPPTSWGYICPCETPEGGAIGVVKNLAITCEITLMTDSSHVISQLKSLEIELFDENLHPKKINNSVIISVNGDFIGITTNPIQVVNQMRYFRRIGVIHPHVSIAFHISSKEIVIHTEAGRVTRPLIIIENGKTRFTPEIIKKIKNKTITWSNLLIGFYDEHHNYIPSVIEYIDAEETECIKIETRYSSKMCYGNDITHCEVHPSFILGAVASMICFPDHNQSPRNTYQSAMGKQSMGIYCTNFKKRLDSMSNILNYPMIPLIQTRVANIIHQDQMPSGNNAIVAIMTYSGFNQEDSLLINKNAIDRGFFHSTFYRTYKDEERKNHMSGEEEKFTNPDPECTRGMKPGSYHALSSSGFAKPNIYLNGGDVIIGKIVPVRDSSKGINQSKPFRDQSTTLRHNENGVIDCVYESRNGDGYRFSKIRVRSSRIPGIGDKFSSCHGQKGTVGMIFNQEDMPFIGDSGISPDMIINPHCIPSRMTIGQLYESIFGKACLHLGCRGDGTAFNNISFENISDLLMKCGMEKHGNEIVINGQTGEQVPCAIFVGPIYEQRLKHMVDDKIHSRATGPKVMLTRQPAEGRARDGGLRFGEMERDCMIGHGSGLFLKERMLDMSDRYSMSIGQKEGLTAAINPERNIYNTFSKEEKKYADVRVPYGWKLLMQELQSMAIAPRLIT